MWKISLFFLISKINLFRIREQSHSICSRIHPPFFVNTSKPLEIFHGSVLVLSISKAIIALTFITTFKVQGLLFQFFKILKNWLTLQSRRATTLSCWSNVNSCKKEIYKCVYIRRQGRAQKITASKVGRQIASSSGKKYLESRLFICIYVPLGFWFLCLRDSEIWPGSFWWLLWLPQPG